MNTELRQRLEKPPPTASRYGLAFMNWVGVVAAALLVPAGLATPFAGVALVMFVLPVQALSAMLTAFFIGRHRLTGAPRRWMLVPVILGAMFSIGAFVAAAFSTGSRC